MRIEGVAVEYIDGCELRGYREMLERDFVSGRISEAQMEEIIFRQILQLLHAIRYYTQFDERMYLHRDIKPGNIMIDRREDVKLVDFDYAHISGSTKTVDVKEIFWNMGFSAGYTSPEVFTGDRMGSLATELYSAGRTVFYWLNGRHYYTEEQTRRSSSAEWGSYVTDEALQYGFAANRSRFEKKYLDEKYAGLLRIMEKMCARPETGMPDPAKDKARGGAEAGKSGCTEDEKSAVREGGRYASADEVIRDMERFLLGWCGDSVSRYEELFGAGDPQSPAHVHGCNAFGWRAFSRFYRTCERQLRQASRQRDTRRILLLV